MATNFPKESYFTKINPSYPDYVGECTWYVHGRAHETTGVTGLPTGNAGTWYNKATNFTRKGPNEIPLSWSVGCFNGHVVFIESVRTSGNETKITFSEANWYPNEDYRAGNGKHEPYPEGTDGMDVTMTWEKFKKRGGGYQGSICLWE